MPNQVTSKLYSKIAGTGSYLPKKILSNQDLETMVDTTDEWIFTRTGIRERHLAAEGEFTSDLAYEAAKNYKEAADAYNQIITKYPAAMEVNDAKKYQARAQALASN